jgi:hypothetical protein
MTTSRRPRPLGDDDAEVRAVRAPAVQPEATASAAALGWGQPAAPEAPTKRAKQPLYPRLLRLQHIHPNAWQRAALGEGAVGVGVLLAMADLATAWSIVALPVAVAVVVKAHDALQGLIDRGTSSPEV